MLVINIWFNRMFPRTYGMCLLSIYSSLLRVEVLYRTKLALHDHIYNPLKARNTFD